MYIRIKRALAISIERRAVFFLFTLRIYRSYAELQIIDYASTGYAICKSFVHNSFIYLETLDRSKNRFTGVKAEGSVV